MDPLLNEQMFWCGSFASHLACNFILAGWSKWKQKVPFSELTSSHKLLIGNKNFSKGQLIRPVPPWKNTVKLATVDSMAAEGVPLACCGDLPLQLHCRPDKEIMEIRPHHLPFQHRDSAGNKKIDCTIFHKAEILTVDLRHANSFSYFTLSWCRRFTSIG